MANDITTLMINRLQALHRGLSGVKFAPNLDKYPTQLQTPSLPAVLTWPGEETFYHKGGGWGYAVHTASVLLFIAPVAQNDIPSNAAAAVSLYDTLKAAYVTTGNIPLAVPGDNTGGYQITLESGPGATHRDGGIEPNLSFGGAAFYGARFSLNVTLQWVPGT